MKINKKKLLSAIFLLLAVSVVLLLAFIRKEPKKSRTPLFLFPRSLTTAISGPS